MAAADADLRANSAQSVDDALLPWFADLADHLARSSNPRHLLIAARLRHDADRTWERADLSPEVLAGLRARPVTVTADSLLRQAQSLGATDPWIWWVTAIGCPATASCNADVARRRVQELAPSNGAVWILTDVPRHVSADLSGSAEDDARDDANLELIASASRFDLHIGESMRAYLDAFEQLPLPDAAMVDASDLDHDPSPDVVRGTLAFALAMEDLPGLMYFDRLCNEAAVERLGESRRERCLAAMQTAWREADSVLIERLASRRLLLLLPAGPERDAGLRASHRSAWQMDAWMELHAPHRESDGRTSARPAEESIALWRAPGATELDVMRGQLEAAGIPLDPPPDWIPSQPIDPLAVPPGD